MLLHGLEHGGAEVSGGLHNVHAGSREGGELGGSSALAAGDDGASVAHASAGGSGGAGDETHDGLVGVAVLSDPVGGVLLGLAADLADHDDALGLGVVGEALQAVNEVGAVERVASDADAGGLAETHSGGLGDGLVSQSARAGHHSDLSLLVNVSRHDADLALLGLDNAGAVRADQSTLGLLVKGVLDLGKNRCKNDFSSETGVQLEMQINSRRAQ